MRDKLMLLLVVLTLPLAVGLLRFVSAPKDVVEEATIEQKLDELDDLLTKLAERDAAEENMAAEETVDFSIFEVSYSTESGKLFVRGSAPKTQGSIFVSFTVHRSFNGVESEEDEIERTDSEGGEINQIAVEVETDGGFSMEIETGTDKGIVEMRLEQDTVVDWYKFDLTEKRQIADQ